MLNKIIYLKTDAVVIGGGLSGLMAAKEITQDPNIDVLMLRTGRGASPYVHGLNIPIHKKDLVETFIQDTLESGHYQSDVSLVEKLCKESLLVLEELNKLDLQLDKSGDEYKLLKPLGCSLPRVACIGNETGKAIIKKTQDMLQERDNFKSYADIRALKLMVKDKEIKGVLAYKKSVNQFVFIQSNAVILACGGFCNIYPFSTNKRDIGGDGIAMAYDAGLPLVDMEFIQFEPSAAVSPKQLKGKSVITTMFYEGAVLRNVHGERFMLQYGEEGEKVNKDVMSRRIYEEIKKGNGTKNKGVYFDATGVGKNMLMESYKSYCDRYDKYGIDISKEMFEIAPAPHTALGGVKTTTQCDTEVKGIFVCGEMIGGIHGANRVGGNAGLETIVYGRQAGKTVKSFLQKGNEQTNCNWKEWIDTVLKSKGNESGIEFSNKRMDDIEKQMQLILSKYISVIRGGNELKVGVKQLSAFIDELEGAYIKDTEQKYYKMMRLRNDVKTAYLVAVAALERDESVGCHIRSDYPKPSKEKYRIILQKTENGETVGREPIKGKVL